MLFSSAFAIGEDASIDLTTLTASELNAFARDINRVIERHHEPNSATNEAALSVVKKAVRLYFAEKGYDVTWAWVNYNYSRTWDFYTVSTHVDYRDSKGNKQKPDVYAELFPIGDEFSIHYLKIGKEVVIDERDKLPDDLWIKTPERIVNASTGVELSMLDTVELNEWKTKIKNEIKVNHTPDSKTSDIVLNLAKYDVRLYFAEQGVDVSWAWFDYVYTCDWGLYTLKTPIDYTDTNGVRQNQKVYAEAYPKDGEYALYYLTVGDEVLVDNRDQLPEDIAGILNAESIDTSVSEDEIPPESTTIPESEATPESSATPDTETTLKAIDAPTSTTSEEILAATYEELTRGSKGEAVIVLQNRLNELGYSVGTADGDFGKKTEAAIKNVQEDNQQAQTGIATSEFQTVLFSNDVMTAAEQESAKKHEQELKNFTQENAKRAAVVAFTNRFANDVFKKDGNTYDVSKFHNYGDLSGFFMHVESEGVWSKKSEDVWHVEGLRLRVNEYNTYVDASLDVSLVDGEFVVSNMTGTAPSSDDIRSIEKESDYALFFVVSRQMLIGTRENTSNPSINNTKPPAPSKTNTLREDQARRAFQYLGDALFPYGFRCHWILGLRENKQSTDGSWYFKVDVTITNQYGADRKAIAEAYINNTTQAVENFTVDGVVLLK
jgi:Putative peptidoglycan-binding domain-containing protein